MKQWMTKDGLKAVFSDAAMAPVRMVTEAYKKVRENGHGIIPAFTCAATFGFIEGAYAAGIGDALGWPMAVPALFAGSMSMAFFIPELAVRMMPSSLAYASKLKAQPAIQP